MYPVAGGGTYTRLPNYEFLLISPTLYINDDSIIHYYLRLIIISRYQNILRRDILKLKTICLILLYWKLNLKEINKLFQSNKICSLQNIKLSKNIIIFLLCNLRLYPIAITSIATLQINKHLLNKTKKKPFINLVFNNFSTK